jgi:hypothetical protein
MGRGMQGRFLHFVQAVGERSDTTGHGTRGKITRHPRIGSERHLVGVKRHPNNPGHTHQTALSQRRAAQPDRVSRPPSQFFRERNGSVCTRKVCNRARRGSCPTTRGRPFTSATRPTPEPAVRASLDFMTSPSPGLAAHATSQRRKISAFWQLCGRAGICIENARDTGEPELQRHA